MSKMDKLRGASLTQRLTNWIEKVRDGSPVEGNLDDLEDMVVEVAVMEGQEAVVIRAAGQGDLGLEVIKPD